MTNFSYLKTWLDHPNPRPIVLECVPSRSGLSLSVYDREKLLYRVNGCGFDRLGTAIGNLLEALFQPELKNALLSFGKPYGNTGWTTCERKGAHVIGEIYGAFRKPDGSISLDGGCGISCMQEIAYCIGLSVQVHETRSSTLLIIQKKG